MLKVGQKAPAFSLDSDGGDKVALKDFAGQNVVLYFYPRDDTPGCTREAQGFAAAQKELAKRNAVAVGVSRDTVASHCKFRDKYHLNFPLLSDPGSEVIQKYGAWGEKSMYGKTSMGILRSTVVIGPDGKIRALFPKVKVEGHVAEVLAALDA